MDQAVHLLATGAVAAVVGLAAWSDLRTRRIPNRLTVAGFVVALLLRAMLGWSPLADGLLGAGLAFLLALPFFAMGAFGGGDAKLLIAAGAFLGPRDLIVALLLTGVAGGLLVLVDTVRRGAILPLLLDTGSLVRYWITFGRSGRRPTLASGRGSAVPYGVAIAAGTLAAWFFPFAEWLL